MPIKGNSMQLLTLNLVDPIPELPLNDNSSRNTAQNQAGGSSRTTRRRQASVSSEILVVEDGPLVDTQEQEIAQSRTKVLFSRNGRRTRLDSFQTLKRRVRTATVDEVLGLPDPLASSQVSDFRGSSRAPSLEPVVPIFSFTRIAIIKHNIHRLVLHRFQGRNLNAVSRHSYHNAKSRTRSLY